MSWYGDPDGLDRLAVRLSAAAADVRDRGWSVRATAAATRWRGPAAQAFVASIGREAGLLDRAADELDDAAAALHRHAESVRAEIARLLAVERTAEHLASAGWSKLKELVP
jgi:PPE-repeat protein